MLPGLGSGSTLRGYQNLRFRDRHSLLMQAEWRVLVNSFIDTGDLLRRRQGRRAQVGSRLQRPAYRLRHRLPAARPAGHAAAHRVREGQRRLQPRLRRERQLLRSRIMQHRPLTSRRLTRTRLRRRRSSAPSLAASHAPVRTATPRFFSDDPLQREPESADASKAPPRDIDLFYDLALSAVRHAGQGADQHAARATSTRSTRCPTRAGSPTASASRPMSADELSTGPSPARRRRRRSGC